MPYQSEDYQAFDVIQLEERLASDYQKMQNPYCEPTVDSSSDDYINGEWDAKVEGKPCCPEKWLTSDLYKQGFIDGLIGCWVSTFL